MNVTIHKDVTAIQENRRGLYSIVVTSSLRTPLAKNCDICQMLVVRGSDRDCLLNFRDFAGLAGHRTGTLNAN
jgi:hypothetical protein